MENDYDLYAFATETESFYHKNMDLAHAGASVGKWQAHISGTVTRAYYKRNGRDIEFNRHDILSAASLCCSHYASVIARQTVDA